MDNKVDRKTFTFVSISAAILGLFGLIIAAIIGILPEIFSLERQSPEDKTHIIESTETSSSSDNLVFTLTPNITAESTPPSFGISEAPTFLIEHSDESIGTGVFSKAITSNGNAEIDYEELNSKYFNVQVVNGNTNPDGCLISQYDTNELWFGGATSTSLFLNGLEIGETYFGNGKHGHIVNISIIFGDEICVDPVPSGGYHIVLGPHMFFHYDSYCFRGNCE
ncbi:MAG: hypothetical protein ACTSQ8_21875 [Candidatus Helarchaeota archaeon]